MNITRQDCCKASHDNVWMTEQFSSTDNTMTIIAASLSFSTLQQLGYKSLGSFDIKGQN